MSAMMTKYQCEYQKRDQNRNNKPKLNVRVRSLVEKLSREMLEWVDIRFKNM